MALGSQVYTNVKGGVANSSIVKDIGRRYILDIQSRTQVSKHDQCCHGPTAAVLQRALQWCGMGHFASLNVNGKRKAGEARSQPLPSARTVSRSSCRANEFCASLPHHAFDRRWSLNGGREVLARNVLSKHRICSRYDSILSAGLHCRPTRKTTLLRLSSAVNSENLISACSGPVGPRMSLFCGHLRVVKARARYRRGPPMITYGNVHMQKVELVRLSADLSSGFQRARKACAARRHLLFSANLIGRQHWSTGATPTFSPKFHGMRPQHL